MVLQSGRGFWSLTLHDQEFKLILIVASTLWVYTTIIHLPFVVPSNYTDVGYLWIRDVYSGHNNMAIPYVDYKLEYPQMIGLIIWIGQAIGTYAPFVLDAYNTYMVVESVLQYPFMIGTIYNICALCSKLGINKNRIYLYLLTSMTFMIYGFYNWDFIVAYFASLSIMYYLEKRYDASSLALTAGILSKFIPICMAPAMVWCLPNNRARVRFITIAGSVWGAVNAPFVLANIQLNRTFWLQLYTHTQNHQLQNTWISMVIQTAGLGDIISGRGYGHYLSLGIIGYLILRALISKRTPLEKILLSWYAWFGAIYLFDPQMWIQLFPIIILTPSFDFVLYRIADILNAFIILFYFIGGSRPELPKYLTDQLTPFGLVNISAALRQLIVLGAYFISFNPARQDRLKRWRRSVYTWFARLLGDVPKRLAQMPRDLLGPVRPKDARPSKS
jgi:hypothetical protein